MLVFKGKAEVIEALERAAPLGHATLPVAARDPARHTTSACRGRVQRKISRRALFARDGWRCVYCGTRSGRLTLDHVVPRSRGGDSVWENVVTSCAPCNLRKGNRLLEEVSMALRRAAAAAGARALHPPRRADDPDGWQPYLRGSAPSHPQPPRDLAPCRRRMHAVSETGTSRMKIASIAALAAALGLGVAFAGVGRPGAAQASRP